MVSVDKCLSNADKIHFNLLFVLCIYLPRMWSRYTIANSSVVSAGVREFEKVLSVMVLNWSTISWSCQSKFFLSLVAWECCRSVLVYKEVTRSIVLRTWALFSLTLSFFPSSSVFLTSSSPFISERPVSCTFSWLESDWIWIWGLSSVSLIKTDEVLRY